MINFPPSIMQSLILFILMVIGYIAEKIGVFTSETIRSVSRFVVDFALPALIIISMQRTFSIELQNQAFRIMILSIAVYMASVLIAFITTKLLYRSASLKELNIHRFAMCFSNVGFMGFPVAAAVLGKESLFIVSIYNIPFQVLVFSIGTMMVADSGQKTSLSIKTFVNPPVIAAVGGLVLFLLSVKIPEPFFTSLDLLGNTTTPLAMILIGAILAQTTIKGMFSNLRLWITSLYRLAAHPLLILFVGKLLGLSGFELQVPVLIAAMPVAANSSILARVYGGDDVTASKLVFITTIASLITIPLILLLL